MGLLDSVVNAVEGVLPDGVKSQVDKVVGNNDGTLDASDLSGLVSKVTGGATADPAAATTSDATVADDTTATTDAADVVATDTTESEDVTASSVEDMANKVKDII